MSWQHCKNILCIRPDNMGDLIMTVPALRALKETFGAKITVLTSSMAKAVVDNIKEIDDSIIFDLPWVKTDGVPDTESFNEVVKVIGSKNFDAAVIFTVYSQNPLPNAMLAYIAGIPRILAYCRENPYHLISDWMPDKEPYDYIKHQVRRDLDLVASVGATTSVENLRLTVNELAWPSIVNKLKIVGLNLNKPWLILHAGVSEKKRAYPLASWAEAAKALIADKDFQILLTGSKCEQVLTQELKNLTGEGSFCAGGLFTLDEFICLISHTPLMLSVNTGTLHIAAAVQTPVVVLYAQTNPQHTPWNVPHIVLPFPVHGQLKSRNEVIRYVDNKIYSKVIPMPSTHNILKAVNALLSQPTLSGQQFRETPDENRAIAAS